MTLWRRIRRVYRSRRRKRQKSASLEVFFCAGWFLVWPGTQTGVLELRSSHSVVAGAFVLAHRKKGEVA